MKSLSSHSNRHQWNWIAGLLAAVTICAVSADVIIDNDDGALGYTESGPGWFNSANATPQGATSRLNASGDTAAEATWTASLPEDGRHNVYAWWVESINRANPAVYEISHLDGIASVAVDQTQPGSQWVLLGNYNFATSQVATVSVSDSIPAGQYVSADAVRFERTGPLTSPCGASPSALTSLNPPSGCGTCGAMLLPGAAEPHPETGYHIISDLPEAFGDDTTSAGNGVLYATTAVLPPDSTGSPVPLALRTQTATGGFTTIDGSFDLFLFHIARPGTGAAPRRITVYVRNDGTAPIDIDPEQIIITDGVIGTIHEMESTLGQRTLEGDWDTPLSTITINPGQGAVIAFSKRFAASSNGADSSANINCFGRVRGAVTNASSATDPTQLSVFVVGIDGASQATMQTDTEALLGVAATSLESAIDITTAPPGCALRRAVGVAPSIVWRGDTLSLSDASIPPTGLAFTMALSEIQSEGCPEGRQTEAMFLHPGFARGDNIGNYMVEYRLMFHLINSDPGNFTTFDIGFGKTGADIGLAWQTAIGSAAPSDAMVDAASVRTGWAGPNQANLSRSFVEFDGGPITLAPCDEAFVGLRFLVLGNSSLPFDIEVTSTKTPVSAELTAFSAY